MQHLETELSELANNELLRSLYPAGVVDGPYLRTADKNYICFSSNNYLGLATHPRVIAAACRAVQEHGCSSTGSRLTSGNLSIHEALEKKIAEFKGCPGALLFNTGYTANAGLLTSLIGPTDLVVADKLVHASLIDGARATGATVRYFRHGNLARAEELLKQTKGKHKFLLTDGVFSMDGDIAELPELTNLAMSNEATIILDEAHATGVIGETGRGTLEHYGLGGAAQVRDLPIIQMGTLGKALGSFGAYVTGNETLRSLLINRARSFIFSTALPPAACGAVLGALEVINEEPALLHKLRTNANWLRSKLKEAGFNVPDGITPIIPVVLGDNRKTVQFASLLRAEGLHAIPIRPPTVPPNSARIRLSVMAIHTAEHLEMGLNAFIKVGRQLEVI